MPDILYGRKYSLIIGKLPITTTTSSTLPFGEYIEAFNDPALRALAADDYTRRQTDPSYPFHLPRTAPVVKVVEKGNYIELTNYQIKALLPQTRSGNASDKDKAYIEVYNVSEEDLGFIRNANIVFFYGGYAQDAELKPLYTGDLQVASSEKKGENTITKLLCTQAIDAGIEGYITKTYLAGDSFAYILTDLLSVAKGYGIVEGSRVRLPSTAQDLNLSSIDANAQTTHIRTDLPVEGPILDVISAVAGMIDYRSYIVLNRLYIEPKNTLETVEMFIVRPENIKGSIKHTNQKSNDPKNVEREGRIELDIFLNGDASANKFLQIKGIPEFKGTYKIIKVEHVLDYEGKEWTTNITATGV